MPRAKPKQRAARDSAGTSRLRVTVPAPASADRAVSTLGRRRGAWLGDRVEKAEPGGGRYLIDLELRVGEAAPRVTFRKAAYVDVGPLRNEPDGPSLDISWRAAGLTPLFPVFAGQLSWRDGVLILDGYYAPPGGGVGVLADRLLLNVAARATGRRLLERIAEAIARP